MSIFITGAGRLKVGEPIVIEGIAPEPPFAAVFEDDGSTGYLYALNLNASEQPIQDALHIYNVTGVVDLDQPSKVEIGWSEDNLKAILLINDYPHAVINFDACRGYCRTNFPPPAEGSAWVAGGHAWSESALKLFE